MPHGSRGIRSADQRSSLRRERGKFYDAERSFGKARQELFEARMLPWFESSISRLKTAVVAEEATKRC
jgi:hypothetical protein